MSRTINIEIKPEILEWAINNSGWSKEEITNKLKISSNAFKGWLDNTKRPTLRQLENLAQVLKRPLAAFFLSEPPKEKPLPKDYRMIPEKEGKFDKKTVLAIRKARRLQRVSKELSKNLKADIESDISSASLSDNPKIIAEKFKQIFDITKDVRKKWKTAYDAFNYLRDSIGDKNVIVFQISMPTEDARGFTLVDEMPAVIVVNSKDVIEARVFTLLHEFGHVLLNRSGISIPDNALFKKEADKVEKWCNEFSSAILLPEELAKEEFSKKKEILIETKTLEILSRKFKISKAMLLYNMSRLNYITKLQYRSVLERYNPLKPIPKKEGQKGGAGVSADKKCINENGQKFVSLVANNIDKGYFNAYEDSKHKKQFFRSSN